MTIRLTTAVLFSFSLMLLAGCDIERTGQPLGSEALVPDPTAEDSAGSAGEVKQPGTEESMPPTPTESVPDDARAQPPGNAPPVGEQSESRLQERTKEILNAKELADDPNWTVAASDPSEVRGFTAAGTALNRAYALAGTANLEQWIKQEHALNGSYPTYQAIQDYIAKNPVDMPRLPREYQHFGYDETTGEVVILESQQEKAARFNELGLPAGE